ncbi:type II toxin-antitoxin system RelE/ParE family toxin [Candidatus Saccharibacteria bacterium]|nr:type II toxin-antitoxin system RelE/ParE family toxin [Candidatus Saccharibacteria bacterium]MCL1962933.1 type II toxin-antitoxin system RelE/ParE family toxin [Candidatus Saccharibacteria bacterium]
MGYQIEFSGVSRNDLVQVYAYYDGTSYLTDFRIQLNKLVDRLSVFPRSGQEYLHYRKAIILKRYLVLYQIKKRTVLIARIFDGRTDYRV